MCDIRVDQLHDPWVVLRPVDTAGVEFLELCDSISELGLILPISARPSTGFDGEFEIIDGLCRVTACRKMGIETVPCMIREATDDQVLVLQLHANAVGIPTTHMEYARRLRRLFTAQPKMNLAELSRRAGKSVKWVSDHLDLLKLPKSIQIMIERGEIPICNAYMLARLRVRYIRDEYIQHAKVMPVGEFRALIAGVIKREMEMVKKGRMESHFVDDFTPHPYQRPLKKVFSELESPEEGSLIIASENCRSALDGWKAALRWTLHLDEQSIIQRKRRSMENHQSHILKHGDDINEAVE